MEITDTERLDWLEEKGNGLGLIHDDDSRWAVAFCGMQNIPGKGDLYTTFFIEKKDFRPTARQAIDLAIKREKRRDK